MVLGVQRGRVEYFKDVDIQDFKRLPEENRQLRERVRDQERQIAEKTSKTHQLEVALASERGFRQGLETGANLGLQIALRGQERKIDGGVGLAGPLQIQSRKKSLLRSEIHGHVERDSLSISSGDRLVLKIVDLLVRGADYVVTRR